MTTALLSAYGVVSVIVADDLPMVNFPIWNFPKVGKALRNPWGFARYSQRRSVNSIAWAVAREAAMVNAARAANNMVFSFMWGINAHGLTRRR